VTEHRIQFSDAPRGACPYARELLAKGADPDHTLALYRGEMRCLTGKVGWFAKRTIEESGKVGPRYARWRPFPSLRGLAQEPESS
jgi:hypothetical protein